MTTLYEGQVCLLKRTLIVFLFMVEPVLIHAQPAAGIDSLVHQAATQFLQDTHHIGLSIGIYDAGAQHQYYFGSVSKDKLIPPTSTTLYEIGSVTKSFTGILLAQAVIDKKINLQDDVQKYLGKRYANLAYEGVPVKIVHLANHTSGLPKNIPQTNHTLTPADMLVLYEHYSESAFLKDMAAVSLRQQPGTVYSYSNADVELIGIILEKVYKMSYCDLLEKFITRPNQMPHTTLLNLPHSGPRALGYNDKGKRQPAPDMWKSVPAAGYLLSTTQDMLAYIRFNIYENNLAVKLAHTTTFTHTDEDDADIGLCWFVKTINGHTAVMHGGGTFGTTSFCLVIPELKKGIVCFANDASPGTETALRQMSYAILSSKF